ncbi:MAG: hypothetical protein LDL41_00165 [Coleofasciculus sp. S288]|nr:hypothetical protein [Coleofasciculus sp. S288]
MTNNRLKSRANAICLQQRWRYRTLCVDVIALYFLIDRRSQVAIRGCFRDP